MALAQGRSAAGFVGAGGDGGRRAGRWRKGCRWRAGRSGQTVGAVGGRKTRGRGGQWPTRWSPTRPLGEEAEGDLVSPTRRRRAVTQAARRGVGGLGGVGACRVLGQPRFHPALPCPFAGQSGRRPGPRAVGLARGLGQVTATGRVTALPPRLGTGRPGPNGQRGHPGPRRCAPGCRDSPRRGRLRPAVPGSGRAPAAATHVRATGSGGGPNPPADGPL